MKKCETCIYRNEDEYHKPCIVYRDDCEFYEKERGDMTREEAIHILDNLKPTNTKSSFDAYVVGKAITMAIKALEQEPCGDAISRQSTLKPYEGLKDDDVIAVWLIRKNIEQQPSVNQEPKTGHWIDNEIGSKCSCCGIHIDRFMKFNYCPNCGCRMFEPQGSDNCNQFSQG